MNVAISLVVAIQLILFHLALTLRADSDDYEGQAQPSLAAFEYPKSTMRDRHARVQTYFRNMEDAGFGILATNENYPGHEDADTETYLEDYPDLEPHPRPRQKRQAQPAPRPRHPLIDPSKYMTHDITLPEGYNIYAIPKDPVHGGALPIFIYIRVKKVLDFDELNEVIVLDMEFQVMWTDFLIMYLNNRTRNSTEEFITAETLSEAEVWSKRRTLNNPYILEKIWKPNLFIEHLLAVQQPSLLARPITVKFIPEVGWFEYITRFSVRLSCEMNFHFYPADTQECDFALRGFAYNKSDLDLNWYKGGVYMEQVEMQSFDLQLTSRRKYEWMKNNDTNDIFTVLAFKVLARRRLNYHLVQTYLSSSFYMIITCLCFVLPPRMIEAKIGMSMTALLTLTSMFASIRGSTPVVSYVKAIDIWMVCCIFFVFLTLCQYTLSTWLKTQVENAQDEHHLGYPHSNMVNSHPLFMTRTAIRDMQAHSYHLGKDRDFRDRKDKDNNVLNGHFKAPGAPQTNGANGANGMGVGVGLGLGLGAPKPHHKRTLSAEVRHIDRMNRYYCWVLWIEKYSFGIFLALFAVGNVVYWTVLLIRADYFDWKVNKALNNVDE